MKTDVAIIGAGPAGLSAAINLKILNVDATVLSPQDGSDKVAAAPKILNYLGKKNITGKRLNDDFLSHAQSLGVKITKAKVNGVYPAGKEFFVDAGEFSLTAKCVILACGLPSTAKIKNEDLFLGRGVSYCATCDGPLFKGKHACAIVYDKSESHELKYLSEVCGKLTVLPVAKTDIPAADNVNAVNLLPKEFVGEKKATQLVCDKGVIEADIFFVLKSLSADRLVAGLTTKNGSVVVDRNCATDIKGVFAAGDVTGKPYKYQKAAGEGLVAAFAAYDFLKNQE